jgi:hypothetical protein
VPNFQTTHLVSGLIVVPTGQSLMLRIFDHQTTIKPTIKPTIKRQSNDHQTTIDDHQTTIQI